MFHRRSSTPATSRWRTSERRGLSVLIDLDNLDDANAASGLFSIGRFNLLSFDERDHGPNHAAGRMIEPLQSYIRRLAAEIIPDKKVARVELLTFPRILGQVFNPISVYRCLDAEGAMLMAVYECNTFGDMHSISLALMMCTGQQGFSRLAVLSGREAATG